MDSTHMEILLFLAQRGRILIPYEGGGSSSVVYILIGLGLLAVFSIISLFFLSKYKIFKLKKLCKQRNLSREEIGFVRDFCKQFHLHNKIEIITDVRHFDMFANRVSHHYENATISEEDLLHEEVILHSIRKKLDFLHDFETQPLKTSRTLPLQHPITITYRDSHTKNKFVFHSTVVYNNDFFVGIKPPEPELAKQIFTQEKPLIQITFVRDKDSEYVFNSQIVRTVNHPHTMWYVRHSQKLILSAPQRTLNIPATLLFTPQETTEGYSELEATIETINNKHATFILRDASTSLQPETGVILNFSADGKLLAWGGSITNIINREGTIVYRSEFSSVTDKDSLIMFKFLRQATQNS